MVNTKVKKWKNVNRGDSMINEIEKIDFNYIEKISIKKCFEWDVIPIRVENKLKIFSSKHLEEKEISFLSLILDEKFKIEIIGDSKIQIFKNIIILEYEKNDIENIVIKEGIKERASDIHFEPHELGVNIRMRVDGLLGIKYRVSLSKYEKMLSRIKNKSNLDITEKRRPQDGKMNFKFENKEYNLRISVIKTIYGEKLVLRILKKSIIRLDFKEIAENEEKKKILLNIVKKRDGLVIVNGPTGAGKSTTLYSILEGIKNQGINITTIEDPVEVPLEGITQIQLNRDINLDFSNALKSVLRQDPDVIMIGEIRDSETAKIAIRSSITGHKVYSTVHSISPREVYFRLHDLGIEERTLKEALIGIISQRLLRRLCERCKEKEVVEIKKEKMEVSKAIGCELCNYTGYKGRVLVAQITKIDKEVSLQKLHEDKELLNNNELIEMGKIYLRNGVISYLDYMDFISEQEE